MRLSWHPEADIVVLSLWRGETCAGTFRMPHADVADFVDALVDGLRDVPGLMLATATPPDPVPATPSFREWAFGHGELDERASAS